MPNPFAHVELSTDDVKKAKKFYASVFAWKLNDLPALSYTMIDVSGGVGGGLQKKQVPEHPSAWLPYVQVDDVKATMAKVVKAGGKVVLDYHEIADMGSIGVFVDPQGATLGLWASKAAAAVPAAPAPAKKAAKKTAVKAAAPSKAAAPAKARAREGRAREEGVREEGGTCTCSRSSCRGKEGVEEDPAASARSREKSAREKALRFQLFLALEGMRRGCTPRPPQKSRGAAVTLLWPAAYHDQTIVDCAEIRQGFLTGGVPSGPSVDEHLRGCAHCNELFANPGEVGRRLAAVASRVPRGVAEQLLVTESLIAHERGPRAFLRSRSTRVRWALSLILPALLLGRELLRKGVSLRELGTTRMLAGLLLLGLLGVVAHSALQPLPTERRTARLRSILALVAWGLPSLLWLLPESPVGAENFSSSGFPLRSLTCFGYGSALAAPSFALLWALDRSERVPYRVWALAAGLVALLSSLILLLHCPSTQRAHLIAGHFSIGLAWFVAVSSATWWTSRSQ